MDTNLIIGSQEYCTGKKYSINLNHDYNQIEIYLKDQSFLPDSIEITAGHFLIFINHEDNSSDPYKICCKDSFHWGAKIWNVYPGQKQAIQFDIPGRYQFSCIEYPAMKV